MRKNGEYAQAAVLLASVQRLISKGYHHAIRFNTGLALLQAGENELAIKSLVSAVKLAVSGHEGPITEGDLPGAGTWITEKFIQEERVQTVLPILAQLADTDAANQPEVAWLLQLYADFCHDGEIGSGLKQ